jgi:hypothetical protein
MIERSGILFAEKITLTKLARELAQFERLVRRGLVATMLRDVDTF